MSLGVDLQGKVALVTGGGGGIGQGIVATLLEAGADVLATDHRREALDAIPGHPRLRTAELDVTSEPACARVMADDLGNRLDLVVNGAGVASRVGMPFTRLEARDWQVPWDVNVVGTFVVSSCAVESMKAAGGGAIVNIASVSGRTGFQTSPPYSASKAAVINFTQVMARDLAGDGIRVNAVCPGMVFTDFYRAQRLAAGEADPSILEMGDQEFFDQKVQRLVPLGHGQSPRDIGAAVAFLCSGLARSITGQSINVDGGLVMS